MADVFLKIGSGVKVDIKEFLDFLRKLGETAELAITPQALIALCILAVPVGEAVATSAAAAAQDGLNIALDAESAQLIIELWPAFQAYLKVLTIQPSKGDKL